MNYNIHAQWAHLFSVFMTKTQQHVSLVVVSLHYYRTTYTYEYLHAARWYDVLVGSGWGLCRECVMVQVCWRNKK